MLSFIIPVYNAESYLSRCLESILNQFVDVNDFEIVIIDDGSTDSSQSIIASYQEKHKNIKAFSQKNKGVSFARNRGIEKALGKYLMFVDADDYLQVNCLGEMVGLVEQNELDFIRFEHQEVSENGAFITFSPQAVKRLSEANIVLTGISFNRKIFYSEYYCWPYLFRTDFIRENEIYFKEGITYLEDMLFLSRASIHANRTMYIPGVCYNYRKNSKSVTSTLTKKQLWDMITIHNELLTQICNRQFPKETQVVILNQISELFLLLVQYLMEPSLFYYHQELLGSLKKCTYKLDNKGGKWRFILSCYNVFGERFVVVLYRIRRMIHR